MKIITILLRTIDECPIPEEEDAASASINEFLSDMSTSGLAVIVQHNTMEVRLDCDT